MNRHLGLVLLLGLTGCGNPAPVPAASTPSVDVNVGSGGPAASPKTCPEAEPLPACTGPGSAQQAVLGRWIEEVDKRVLQSEFKNWKAIATRARLLLIRDGNNGEDATNAKLDAKRVMAVRPDAAEARLVAALGVARSVAGGTGDPPVNPVTWALRLQLADRAVSQAMESADASPSVLDVARGFRAQLALLGGDRNAASALASESSSGGSKVATAELLSLAGDGDAERAAWTEVIEVYSQDAIAGVPRRFEQQLARAGCRPSPGSLAAIAAWMGPSGVTLSWPDLPLAEPSSPKACGPVTHPDVAVMCMGVDKLVAAANADERGLAADEIVAAFKSVRPLCEKGDAACGPEVAQALLDAARASDRTGQAGRGVAIRRMLLSGVGLPKGKAAWEREVTGVAKVELADQYVELAMFSEAQQFYEQVGREESTPLAQEARKAAELLGAAFGDAAALRRLGVGNNAAGCSECAAALKCVVRSVASELGWPLEAGGN